MTSTIYALTFQGYHGIPYGVKKDPKNRLALLRDEMGITQAMLAQRTGLSLPYIKKLEQGAKPLSKRPAVAVGIATGVDWRWLTGRGKSEPIMARLGLTKAEITTAFKSKPSQRMQKLLADGVPWGKRIADTLQDRRKALKTNDEEKRERDIYGLRQRMAFLRLGSVIQTAIRNRRGELAFGRIEDFIRDLAAEPWLKPEPAKPTCRRA